jgi:nucleoside-diphosphate-sugar epimerase
MSSEQYPLRQSGIYRNLPSFDPALTGLKAIVCGATGISGFHDIRALLDSPDRWSTIYAVSRSPLSAKLQSLLSEDQRSRIHHISVDLSNSSDQIQKTLQDANVEADYIFYYAYIAPTSGGSALEPSTAGELVETNVPAFKNFLQALAQAQIKPKRILLQTGGKNYGVHIGRARTPLVESDPQPKHLAPNFYYQQEDLLRSFCEEHPETGWNVVIPCAVIGATEYASMSAFFSFGIYAAVQAHRKEPLIFNGDFAAWQFEAGHSTARLTGYLSEWAVLEEKCKNQYFNAMDGGTLSWDRFFNELRRWFGVERVQGPEEDASKLFSIKLAGGKEAPLGYGPPVALNVSSTLMQWSADPAVHRAWREMMQQSNGQLTKDMFDDKLQDVFLGDFALMPIGVLSLNKVRRFGFCGFVDTLESVFEMYTEMETLGLPPPMKVDSA